MAISRDLTPAEVAGLHDLWTEWHPVEANQGIEEHFEDAPTLPTIDHLPALVDYSTRAAGDWVVSGPMGSGRGEGRYFGDEIEAYRWAVKKYGATRVSRVFGGENRWAMLIKAVT